MFRFAPTSPYPHVMLSLLLRCVAVEPLLPVSRTLVMGINISYDMEAFASCLYFARLGYSAYKALKTSGSIP